MVVNTQTLQLLPRQALYYNKITLVEADTQNHIGGT